MCSFRCPARDHSPPVCAQGRRRRLKHLKGRNAVEDPAPLGRARRGGAGLLRRRRRRHRRTSFRRGMSARATGAAMPAGGKAERRGSATVWAMAVVSDAPIVARAWNGQRCRRGGSRCRTDRRAGLEVMPSCAKLARDRQSAISTRSTSLCRRAGAAASAPGIATRVGRDAGLPEAWLRQESGSVARRHFAESIFPDMARRAIEPGPSPSFGSETEAPKRFACPRNSRRVALLLYLANSEERSATHRAIAIEESDCYGSQVQSGMACPIAAWRRSTPK